MNKSSYPRKSANSLPGISNNTKEHLRKLYGSCPTCSGPNTHRNWCQKCNSKRFYNNFSNWTSGNKEINNFLREIQLNAISHNQVLEWIPYNQFYNFEFVAKGGFATVYSAVWTNGFIVNWDHERNDWERKPKWKVALKTLDKSAKITPEFINEIKICLKCGGGYGLIRCYGISQHPVSKNYIIVLYYAHKGNLRSYLDQHYGELNWIQKLKILKHIAVGLKTIHQAGYVHRDFHSGNILLSEDAEIADLGFAGPAEKQPLINKKTIYGVLPYIAPEILRGGKYTPEADVYSFGIIMCDVLCCIPPFDDRSHDAYLALGICLGLRPAIEKDSPKPFVKLMSLCWDANPINRPKANKLSEILDDWYWKLYDKLETPESLAFMASDNNMPQPGSQASSRTVTQTHPLAFYTSGSFSFQNLPIPINSPSINYRSSSVSYSDMTRNIDFRTEHTRQPDTTTILESGIIESEPSTINGSTTSEVTSESDEYEYITRQLDLAL